MPYYLAGKIEHLKARKQAVLATKKVKMTELLMISLCFLCSLRLKVTVFNSPKEILFAGFTSGALQMTRRLRMSISQKLASWKGSTEDVKAGKYKIHVNPVNLVKNTSSLGVFVAKTQRNLRNPRLINDLQLRKITYEKINLFLQNEPKFRKSQMNVNDVLTTNYEQMDTWSIGKNEPKTNPNEPNFSPKNAKTNPNEPNSKPKQTQNKTKKPAFSLGYSEVNFRIQRIDGPVQIAKILENVCLAHKGLCF